MRTILMLLVIITAPALVAAQPGSDQPAGSAAGGDKIAAPEPAPPVAAPPPAQPPALRSPAELRQICAEAMNADPSFAEAIAKTVNEETLKQHLDAGKAIAKNEKHVILAYAAMWLVAAGFVLFLWRRQQALKLEIAQLRRDLDTAAK